jgi:DNA-binding NtrC family response regulator
MSDKVIHVLSIEDNPANAFLVETLLAEATRLGWDLPRFDMEHVDNVSAGLKRLKEGGIDVVLSDLDLPDSQAGQTVATLREHLPHMPIVVLTGREDAELARASVRAGEQDYLFKNEATGSLLAHALIYAIERQENAQALQKAHTELEQRVEARTRELRRANAEFKAESDQ